MNGPGEEAEERLQHTARHGERAGEEGRDKGRDKGPSESEQKSRFGKGLGQTQWNDLDQNIETNGTNILPRYENA